MKLKPDTFFKHNVIFFFGSLAVSAVNYLYTPILSRMLGVAQFGEVQALLSLFTQTTAIYGALGLVAVNVTAHASTDAEADENLKPIRRWSFIIFGLIVIGAIVGASSIHETFPFSNIWTVASLLVLAATGIFLLLDRAVLTAQSKFGILSILGITAAGGRLIAGMAYIGLFGWSVTGAVAGQATAGIAAALLAWYFVKRSRRAAGSTAKETIAPAQPAADIATTKLTEQVIADEHGNDAGKSNFSYALLIMLTSGFTTMLCTADILAVKYWFPSDTAGLYSGISTISNTIYFLTGSIVGVLFPSIKRYASFESNMKFLTKALGLTLLIGGGALIVFALVPNLIVSVLLGQNYVPFAHYLPRISTTIFFVTIANLLFYYFLALRDYSVLAISFILAAFLGTMLYARHSTIDEIISAFMLTAIASTVMLGSLYLYHYFAFRKTYEQAR